MKKVYSTPALVEYGDVATITADTRENSSTDTFFSVTGPMTGVGGSFDTCDERLPNCDPKG